MFTLNFLTNSDKIYVAYSGGVDSHVVLYTLYQLKIPCAAIHINHQLSPNAAQWQQHCANVCKQLAIPFHSLTIDAKAPKGHSPEAWARLQRYQAFANFLPENSYLLLGHHQNDQVETVLLQLLRGAGVKGLAAMSQQEAVNFGKSFLLRPLLNFTREEIKNFALQNELNWIEDESNQDQRFDRNYLRNTILPLLTQRWPNLNTTISRSAQWCAEADALLTELAQVDYDQVYLSVTKTLSIPKLLTLSIARQRNLIRYWLSELSFSLPSSELMERIIQDVIHARDDAKPKVTWNSVEIRRYQTALYALQPLSTFDTKQVITWDLQQALTLPANLGIIHCPTELIDLKGQQCQIHFRHGSERFHPQGRQGSHPLKKLFQEWNIPPWQRDRIPLLFHQNKLLAVFINSNTIKLAERLS